MLDTQEKAVVAMTLLLCVAAELVSCGGWEKVQIGLGGRGFTQLCPTAIIPSVALEACAVDHQ